MLSEEGVWGARGAGRLFLGLMFVGLRGGLLGAVAAVALPGRIPVAALIWSRF